MIRTFSLATLFFVLATPVYAAEFGHYIGSVKAEWLDDGRKMRLLDDFAYVDKSGEKWLAPKNWVVDGASIPKLAWSLIGGPFEGKYRNASVIHDVGCDQKSKEWEKVHETFFWAMRASNVENWRAKVMYAAVYHFGPRWDRKVVIKNLPSEQTPVAMRKALASAEPGSKAKVARVKEKYFQVFGQRIPTGKADFEILIQPPHESLSKAEFENLKKEIEVRESSIEGSISLEDIRKYKSTR